MLVAGPHILVYINNFLIGAVESFSFSNTIGHKEMRGCDFHLPFEIGPTNQATALTLNLLRTHGTGGAQGQGLMPQVGDVPMFKYVSLIAVDRMNGQAIFRSDYAVATSEHWDVPKKDLVRGTVSFILIGYSNESANSLSFGEKGGIG